MALSKKADHDFSSKMLKTQEKSKTDVKTIRFQLSLGESNEKTCPELNYRELIESEGKKVSKKLSSPKEKDGVNQMDIDDEDREQMQAMARKFEEKYGGPTKTKKRKNKRSEDYVDLGAGYDDNDSFIDNTEVYDEIVPCEMTTAQGGFYINCGALEFKQVEVSEPISEDEDQIKARKKKNSSAAICSDSSSDDDDDSDEDDDDDDDSDDSAEGSKADPEPAKESQPTPAATTNGITKAAEKPVVKSVERPPPAAKVVEKAEKPVVKPPKPVDKPTTVKAVETSVIANHKESSSGKTQVLKRPSPDSVSIDVPPSKKPSSSPEIIELDLKEPKKPVVAKPASQSSAISLETALKNVPDIIVTMKPQQKAEVPKEKASSGMSYLLHQLKGALASVAYQNNDNSRLNNQEKSSPLETPWSREISKLIEKHMDILITPEGRLDKGIIESKILPLWPNSWMYRDNLYSKLKAILRKLISGTSQHPATSKTASTTITPIPPKSTKPANSDPNFNSSAKSFRHGNDKLSPQVRNQEPKESRESKIMYSRNNETTPVDDLLTQVIKEHLPSPKPSSSNRSSPASFKSEPNLPRQLKLVNQEDLRSAKPLQPNPPNLDSEASVQMEMRRVMQELVELNEKRSLFSPAPLTSEQSGSGSSRMGAASSHLGATYPDPFQHFMPRHCDDKQSQMELYAATMSQMAKAGNFQGQPPGFLTSAIGFQEEFRRHLSSSRNAEPLFPPNLPSDFLKNWKF